MKLGVSVEEEGRQGRALLRGRQPGLRVHIHWDPSVDKYVFPVDLNPGKKNFRLGEKSTRVQKAVKEAISYWQDTLKVRRRVARSSF